MGSKKVNILAKFIILFSFVLIFVGIFLSFKEEKIVNEKVPDDDVIRITNNDDVVAEGGTNKADADRRYNDSLSIEEKNDYFRSTLEVKYGVIIKYGEETDKYSVGGLETYSISDPYEVESALNSLANDLSLFPDGFFKEFSNSKLFLTINLISKYSVDNVTGVTEPINNGVIISIATIYPFDESFSHEIYHYIEKYIEMNGGGFSNWNKLNPSDFKYGDANPSLSFSETLDSNSYFVNVYAQTDADEDRASTFEYMMALEKTSCLNKYTPIWYKAQRMADTIDLYFDTVNSSTIEYWERFL